MLVQDFVHQPYVSSGRLEKDIFCAHLHSLSPSGEHGFVVVADVLEPEQARKPWRKRRQTAERFGMCFSRKQNFGGGSTCYALVKTIILTLFWKITCMLLSLSSLFLGFYLSFFGGGHVIEASLEFFPVIGN